MVQFIKVTVKLLFQPFLEGNVYVIATRIKMFSFVINLETDYIWFVSSAFNHLPNDSFRKHSKGWIADIEDLSWAILMLASLVGQHHFWILLSHPSWNGVSSVPMMTLMPAFCMASTTLSNLVKSKIPS